MKKFLMALLLCALCAALAAPAWSAASGAAEEVHASPEEPEPDGEFEAQPEPEEAPEAAEEPATLDSEEPLDVPEITEAPAQESAAPEDPANPAAGIVDGLRALRAATQLYYFDNADQINDPDFDVASEMDTPEKLKDVLGPYMDDPDKAGSGQFLFDTDDDGNYWFVGADLKGDGQEVKQALADQAAELGLLKSKNPNDLYDGTADAVYMVTRGTAGSGGAPKKARKKTTPQLQAKEAPASQAPGSESQTPKAPVAEAPQASQAGEDDAKTASDIISDLRSLKAASLMYYADNMDEVDAPNFSFIGTLGAPEKLRSVLGRYIDDSERFGNGRYVFEVGEHRHHWFVGFKLDQAGEEVKAQLAEMASEAGLLKSKRADLQDLYDGTTDIVYMTARSAAPRTAARKEPEPAPKSRKPAPSPSYEEEYGGDYENDPLMGQNLGGAPRAIRGNRVNLRAESNTDARVLRQMNDGYPVTALRRNADGGWVLVRTPDGREGWVFGQYIRERKKSDGAKQKRAQTPRSYGGVRAAIRGNRVNIRARPDLSARVVTQLNNGAPVEATQRYISPTGDVWYHVYTSNGRSGWVFSRYIRGR